MAADDPVVMRRSGDPMDEAPGGHRNTAVGSKSAPLLHHHVPDTTTQNRSFV